MVPFFFGAQSRPLFGAYHPPPGSQEAAGSAGSASREGPGSAAPRGAGVVLCNPFGHEALHAHRAMRHLAERLAVAGFPALRFDYDGTGDSAGDDREGGRVAAWRASIVAAASALRERAGVERVALVGLRAGALLSLVTAAEAGADRLVLWHPVASGRAHVRELLRLHKLIVPKRKDEGAPPEDEEALGFVLRKETAADLGKLDALGLAELAVSGCLVIGGNDNPTEDKLLEKLRSLGVAADYQHLPGHPFLVADPHKSVVPDEMVTAIVDHLSAAYPAEGEIPPPPPSLGGPKSLSRGTAITAGPASEQAWLIDGPQPRFGVLTLPREPRGGRPAIVLMNAGSIHRVGPNRAFVRMARRWADLGYAVLRMDLSGIGDSPVLPGCTENVPYPRDAVLDAQAAMGVLAERGVARRFVLSGLCSGADIAFRAAVVDPRVAGVWMINPQAFHFESSDALKAFMYAELEAAYYQSGVWDIERWKRMLRGQVDLGRIAGVVRRKVESSIKRRAARLLGRRAQGAAAPETRDVIQDLRQIASRGTDTFLLCSEDDPGLLYLMKYFGAELDSLDGMRGYRKEIVKGVDHTFTPVWSQDMLSDMLTEHLLKKHP